MPLKLCRHCRERAVNRPRGLCWTCYGKPEVLKQYPPLTKYEVKPEETDADLDAMIAEQMKNLPDWWEKSCTSAKAPKPVETLVVFPVVRRRGGVKR